MTMFFHRGRWASECRAWGGGDNSSSAASEAGSAGEPARDSGPHHACRRMTGVHFQDLYNLSRRNGLDTGIRADSGRDEWPAIRSWSRREGRSEYMLAGDRGTRLLSRSTSIAKNAAGLPAFWSPDWVLLFRR
jgi:hypothetical protein